MSPDDFRRIALGMADAIESEHMGHPDFRVVSNGRIFATLHADTEWGMVKLTPDEQRRFMHEYPVAFAPESGAWGRSGCTAVRLDVVDEDALGEAITLAWQNIAKAPASGQSQPRKPAKPGKSTKIVKSAKAKTSVKSRKSPSTARRRPARTSRPSRQR